MLRKTLMGITLVALFAAPIATAQTADELVAKNIEAKGGLAKIKAVKTMRLTGRMMGGQGMEFPFTISSKRPNSSRIEFSFQGMTGMQVYDGKTAWMSMPFMGKKEPEVMPADQAKNMEEQAEFDGPLVDYKEKGSKVELVGKEPIEGADAYKLKLTLKNGDVRHYYLDAETYLEIKSEAKRMIMGSEVETEAFFSDYKEVGGMMMPHSQENGVKGQPARQKMTIEKVELNPEINDSIFSMASVASDTSATAAAKGAAATGTAKATDAAGKAGKTAATTAAAKADSAKKGGKKP